MQIKMLTVREYAARLGVSTAWVYRLIAAGRVRWEIDPLGGYRVSAEKPLPARHAGRPVEQTIGKETA